MPLGCGCLFALAAASAPRIVLVFTWLFTPLVSRAFQAALLLPLVGIIFLPFTTLMYVFAWSPAIGVTGAAWLWVLLGFLVDLSSYTSSAIDNRRGLSRDYGMPA